MFFGSGHFGSGHFGSGMFGAPGAGAVAASGRMEWWEDQGWVLVDSTKFPPRRRREPDQEPAEVAADAIKSEDRASAEPIARVGEAIAASLWPVVSDKSDVVVESSAPLDIDTSSRVFSAKRRMLSFRKRNTILCKEARWLVRSKANK